MSILSRGTRIPHREVLIVFRQPQRVELRVRMAPEAVEPFLSALEDAREEGRQFVRAHCVYRGPRLISVADVLYVQPQLFFFLNAGAADDPGAV